MDQEKWMLMTYYCPTHGDSPIVNPIEITKKEISESYLKKEKNSKKITIQNSKKNLEKASKS